MTPTAENDAPATERLAQDDERLAAELRARGWTVIPPGECEWCSGKDVDGQHENGCRLGLGPDEVGRVIPPDKG